MDREILQGFIRSYNLKYGSVMIHFKNWLDFSPFYDELKEVGIDFEHALQLDFEFDIINYIIWIDIERDRIWLSSPSRNNRIISLGDFRREYNLYTLLSD